MSDQGERRWGDYVTSIEIERVLGAFPDARPHTTAEVADAIGVMEHTARNRLEDLLDDGRVGRRELAVGDEPVELWYLTGEEHVRRDRDPATPGVEPTDDDIEAALADLDLPGASDLMREWRRDAIRATFWYLVDHGPAEPEAIQEGVYPSHQAGYTDREQWWDMVESRLSELPGVRKPGWPGQPWVASLDGEPEPIPKDKTEPRTDPDAADEE